MEQETKKALQDLIETYNRFMKVMESDSKIAEDEGRSYGGFIRATKGKLQEFITHQLIRIAWINELQQKAERLVINSDKIPIPLRPEYLQRVPANVRRYIESHIDDYYYKLSVDKHAFIDGKFVLGVECKAYTENAMIKRIMVDFMFLKTKYPNLKCYLFQLESMLGGDYHELNSDTMGGTATHSIMSYFETVDLHILTLIRGERKVDCPINKPEFFKPLEIKSLEKGVLWLADAMKEYI